MTFYVKVSKSRKQFMVSSILPKDERWDNFMYWKWFCFRDCLTFNNSTRALKGIILGVLEWFQSFTVRDTNWASEYRLSKLGKSWIILWDGNWFVSLFQLFVHVICSICLVEECVYGKTSLVSLVPDTQ